MTAHERTVEISIYRCERCGHDYRTQINGTMGLTRYFHCVVLPPACCHEGEEKVTA